MQNKTIEKVDLCSYLPNIPHYTPSDQEAQNLSTTRIMRYMKDTNSIDKVKATRSLLVTSCPCEQKAAHIRNETVEAMDREDISDVVFRYLQNKLGEKATFNEAIEFGATALLPAMIFIVNEIKLFSPLLRLLASICFLGCAANVIPNIANTRRYGETKDACMAWLGDKVKPDTVRMISRSHMSMGDVSRIMEKLENENIDVTSLKNRNR